MHLVSQIIRSTYEKTEAIIDRNENHPSAARMLATRHQAVTLAAVILPANIKTSSIDPHSHWDTTAVTCLPDRLREQHVEKQAIFRSAGIHGLNIGGSERSHGAGKKPFGISLRANDIARILYSAAIDCG